MNETERVEAAWKRIEQWLRANLPEVIESLNDPATEDAIAAVEAQIGVRFPDALRASFHVHDGESNNWPGAMADGHQLLPLAEVTRLWTLRTTFAAQFGGREDTPAAWRASTRDGIIFVKGPVKPLLGSPRWIPLTDMNGDVQRLLDFDPPTGGTSGQVIEVDPECCRYEVIAPSFLDHLERYAAELEAGRYSVRDGIIASPPDTREDPRTWGIPEYLQVVRAEPWAPDGASEVTFTGTMGFLRGGTQIVFSLRMDEGGEHTFVATPDRTNGYGAIRARQRALVRARPFEGEVEGDLLRFLGGAPEFLAVEYALSE